ncbi:MAG: sigma-54-dependent Fis family transcriptional regulator [Bdellovibrionales bacterium]|nr:sigma-54-dependent Fis family transcriptional regulator [Bdellovibrionales bacterium]
MIKVLVVDDDAGLRLSVRSSLASSQKYEIAEAVDGLDAVEKVKKDKFNVVLLDVDMPRLSGLDALKEIKKHDPSIIVIIMTAFANIDDAVIAVKEGAYNYVSKPVQSEDLLNMINNALEAYNLISSIAASSPIMMDAGRKIIGNTTQMVKVFNIINKLSKVDTPVLVRGESGTGKELIARAIHSNSARKTGRFVAINCSAIPENLFESELFGHEKGAFTGADQRKIGKFQYAEGGTLFLDEVGDMPALMQVKLLRVLQEKVFTPVGSNREIESNVRIVAATNRPLEDMIKKGDFREDLYYRLNVMPITLPSLRERKKDIPSMINMFIKKFNESHGKQIVGLTADATHCLQKYDWPGNIRELENVIEHAFILQEGKQIQITSLPETILEVTGVDIDALAKEVANEEPCDQELTTPLALESASPTSDEAKNGDSIEIGFEEGQLDFNKQKEAFEKEFIIKALKSFNGRINQTALHANIPKKTLLRKIEKYGINAKDYTQS